MLQFNTIPLRLACSRRRQASAAAWKHILDKNLEIPGIVKLDSFQGSSTDMKTNTTKITSCLPRFNNSCYVFVILVEELLLATSNFWFHHSMAPVLNFCLYYDLKVQSAIFMNVVQN